MSHELCQTCGEKGVPFRIEGGATVYSYPCTSEVVVYDDPKQKVRIVKACPDLGSVGRERTILSRSEEQR